MPVCMLHACEKCVRAGVSFTAVICLFAAWYQGQVVFEMLESYMIYQGGKQLYLNSQKANLPFKNINVVVMSNN